MNTLVKSVPVDKLTSLRNERAEIRAELAARKASIPVKDQRISELALAIRRGNPEAIADAATLRAERREAEETVKLLEDADRQLTAEIEGEAHKEQDRLDRHLKRKTNKAIQALPAAVKDMERGIKLLAESLAALRSTTEPIGISWRSTWPQKPTILYTATIDRLVGHALYVALRDAGIKLPELRFSEREFPGLHQFWTQHAAKAKRALLGEADAAIIDDPLDDPVQPVSREPMPVKKQEAPHVWTDAELAENERLGNPAGFPMSGREYLKQRDHAKQQTIAEGVDFDPI